MPTSPIGRRPRVVCHMAAFLDGRNVVLTDVDVAVAKSL